MYGTLGVFAFFISIFDLIFLIICFPILYSITLTSIAAKVYHDLLFNRMKPEIKKILRKNQKSSSDTIQSIAR